MATIRDRSAEIRIVQPHYLRLTSASPKSVAKKVVLDIDKPLSSYHKHPEISFAEVSQIMRYERIKQRAVEKSLKKSTNTYLGELDKWSNKWRLAFTK